MSLLFKSYSLTEVMYLLIRFNKSKFFSWNTNHTDEISVNEAEMDLANVLFNTADFSKKIKARSKEDTIKKYFW